MSSVWSSCVLCVPACGSTQECHARLQAFFCVVLRGGEMMQRPQHHLPSPLKKKKTHTKKSLEEEDEVEVEVDRITGTPVESNNFRAYSTRCAFCRFYTMTMFYKSELYICYVSHHGAAGGRCLILFLWGFHRCLTKLYPKILKKNSKKQHLRTQLNIYIYIYMEITCHGTLWRSDAPCALVKSSEMVFFFPLAHKSRLLRTTPSRILTCFLIW